MSIPNSHDAPNAECRSQRLGYAGHRSGSNELIRRVLMRKCPLNFCLTYLTLSEKRRRLTSQHTCAHDCTGEGPTAQHALNDTAKMGLVSLSHGLELDNIKAGSTIKSSNRELPYNLMVWQIGLDGTLQLIFNFITVLLSPHSRVLHLAH